MGADLPATPVLAQFEMGKNDPVLQALKPFILQNLCSLGQVTILGTFPRGEETKSLHIEFFDERRVCHRVEGTLHRHDAPKRQAHPTFIIYIWTIDENWGYAW
jgi:hypothetical protein